MRNALLGVLLGLAACMPPPSEGSVEWVADVYSKAYLKSDADTMRQHASSGNTIDAAFQNTETKDFRVVKVCTLGGNEAGTRKNLLVLVEGNKDGTLRGLDLIAVQEEGSWKIQSAKPSVKADGSPRIYLRNCEPKS